MRDFFRAGGNDFSERIFSLVTVSEAHWCAEFRRHQMLEAKQVSTRVGRFAGTLESLREGEFGRNVKGIYS